MSRLVVSEFMTLDGVMEDPGGAEGFVHGGWSFKFQDPEGMAFKLEEVMSHGSMLLGRRTYEGFAAAWPARTDSVGFADKMNSMPKYVVSSTLERPQWSNSTVVGSDAAAAATELKRQQGPDILVAGSRTLVQALIAADLVDEIRLMVFPIVLGSGKRLFGDAAEPRTLKLVSSRALPSGTLILTYERASETASSG
ncbi:MAG: dihydrofolate reductase family protein [Solirubrobacteraceae bacterium]